MLPSIFTFKNNGNWNTYSDINHYIKDEPANIIENLWLGNFGHGIYGPSISKYKFDFIVNLGAHEHENSVENITINLSDYPDVKIKDYFDTTTSVIHEQLEKNKNVYVHCHAGVSRSTTMIIAYLMKYKNMSLESALMLCRKKRPMVNPNSGFMEQLRDYEQELYLNMIPKRIVKNHD